MRFLRAALLLSTLSALLWLASGLRWPGFSDPEGDWFRTVSQLSATVLGGAIAASVTWYFANKKTREDKRASLIRLFLQLVKISGGLTNTLRTIDEMLADANDKGRSSMHLWSRILPITGLPEAPVIDVTDLAPLIDFSETGIVNNIILLDQRNRSLLDSISRYNTLRTELRDHLPPGQIVDRLSSLVLSQEQMGNLEPRFLELEDLITSSLKALRADVPFAKDILADFSIAAKKATKRAFPSVKHTE